MVEVAVRAAAGGGRGGSTLRVQGLRPAWAPGPKSNRGGSIAEQAKHRVIDRPGPGQIRLIGEDGKQIGLIDLAAAVQMADEQELDLVELNPNSDPPTCKLMDFGKFKYTSSKKAGKGTKIRRRKEVKLRPKTEQHDFEVKLRNAKRFLEGGHKVLVTMVFRGREQRHPELGVELLNRFAAALEAVAKVERPPAKEAGNRISMLLSTK
jgi:translation initiation factor IF-3